MRAKLFSESFVGAMAQEPNYGLLCCGLMMVAALVVLLVVVLR